MPLSARWCELLARLGSRPRRAALVAALLVLPSLWGGFAVDDHMQRLGARGHPRIPGTPRSPFDLFSFLDGDAERTHQMVETVLGTWILDPEIRLDFLRPLASLSHAIDYALWPDAARAMHLQNILWYVLLVVAAGLLYRRLEVDPRVAGLAVVLFAIDDGHGVPVGWIWRR